MKNYVSPVIFDNEELAEGVYATGSGTGCWTVSENSHQSPEEGRLNWRFQLDARHVADHDSTAQEFVITFNIPVTFVDCREGDCVSGNNTETLHVKRIHWANGNNESVGLGDLDVIPYGKEVHTTVSFVSGYVICTHA